MQSLGSRKLAVALRTKHCPSRWSHPHVQPRGDRRSMGYAVVRVTVAARTPISGAGRLAQSDPEPEP
jgi:hypothetical protein